MHRALTLLGRGLRLRCPACGHGGLFAGWLRVRPSCPHCGLWLEREEGYFLGAMLLNLLVAELVCVVGVLLVLLRSWPNPPWPYLQWGAPAAAVLLPVLFYPWSKSLWLALDHLVHPGQANDDSARTPAQRP